MTGLRDFAVPFPASLVKQVGPRKDDYVSWHHYVQRLLAQHGAFDWDISQPFESGDEKEPVAVKGVLTVTVDGEYRTVAGAGQGRDYKTAESDALKRAACKLGMGLHLWAQDEYWLEQSLSGRRVDTVETDKT